MVNTIGAIILPMDHPQDIHTNSSKADLQFATPSRRIMSWIPIILVSLGIVGLLVILAGKYINRTQNKSENILGTKSVAVESTSVGSLKTKTLLVDISGAVVKPGVYELPDDSRIQDVLISADGLDPNADRNYVARSINLAQKITDGQKIYVPFKNEVPSSVTSGGTGDVNEGGIVSINAASASQLDVLVGVGPVTAQKIISGRPYSDINELVTKKIVSKNEFDKIKGDISI